MEKSYDYLNAPIIDMKEFIWRLLEKWKTIGIFAICVMALFVGLMQMRYRVSANRESSEKTTNNHLTAEEIVGSLPEEEQTLVMSAYRVWQEREQYSDYIYSAPIMQIDPNHVKHLRISWAIDDSEKDTNMVALSYAVKLQSDDCRKALVQASGADIREELFNDLVLFTFPNIPNQATAYSDVVCCDVFLTDDMNAEAVQEELLRQFSIAQENLQEEVGGHQAICIQNETTTVSDERVYTKQTNILNNYANMNNQLSNLKNTFTSGQREAFSKLLSKEYKHEETVQKSTTPNALSLRTIVLGLILGALLYIGIFFLYVVLSNRIISTNMIQDTTIRVAGEWYNIEDKKNPILCDRFLWKKHHHRHLDITVEEETAAQALITGCKLKKINSLLFVFTAEATEAQGAFVNDMVVCLEKERFDPKVEEKVGINGLIDDSLFLDTDGVVLVVLDSKTKMVDLCNIATQCKNYEKPIIGTIYLG